jgi:hypothetical protein
MSPARFLQRSGARGLLLAACLAVTLSWSQQAAAQASSWIYVGGGAGVLDWNQQEKAAALQVDTGFGTAATHPLVLGGLLRFQGYFGSGVDLSLLARLATSGFARGGFGIALDAGVYQRWWGEDSTGLIADLTVGLPWGLTIVGGATADPDGRRLYFATAGLDFARLTVHRHSGLGWFANPMRSPEE